METDGETYYYVVKIWKKGNIQHVTPESDSALLDRNKEKTQIAYQNKDIKANSWQKILKGKRSVYMDWSCPK